jgi:hypothetical protein
MPLPTGLVTCLTAPGPPRRSTVGLRSACAHTGATSLDELHKVAVIGVQGAAGYSEGMPLPTGW